jgi:lipopolysaccharide/colanic/teichoic acid biosynthesis glycosyltransferase
VEELLLWIKHRMPFVWRGIDWLNAHLFTILYRDRLRRESEQCFQEFGLDRYRFRALCADDLDALSELLHRQADGRLDHFKPHGFDKNSLKRIWENPSFLMFGAFCDATLVGYFFLRCFWSRRCFVGRLIDQEHEGKGIGRVMNEILYNTAWRSEFRCHTTISKDNAMVMRSHANNPNVRILKELPNNYLFIEFIHSEFPRGLKPAQAAFKRAFDLILAVIGLLATGWIIVIAWLLATIDTGANGFFKQQRVGYRGRLFTAVKIRTMRKTGGNDTTVTTSRDSRITVLGRFWRRTKIDELPQLFNVLMGHMSFVGPRPDVPGFADRLHGDDRIVLSVRPGITGPATIKYRDEEELLASKADPEGYNRDIIFPDKVRVNREYIEHWSFGRDIRCIFATLFRMQRY